MAMDEAGAGRLCRSLQWNQQTYFHPKTASFYVQNALSVHSADIVVFHGDEGEEHVGACVTLAVYMDELVHSMR